MKSQFMPIIIATIAFTVGFIVSDVRQVNNSTTPTNKTNSPTQAHQASVLNDPVNQLGLNIGSNKLYQSSITQQDQEKLLQLLNKLPEDKINTYLKQVFPEQDLEGINNKKEFAERLIEELNKNKNDTKNLTGEINFSTSPITSNEKTSLNSIHAQQYIYAHFNTFGKSPPNTQVFIKWINQDTQEIVLFTPKYIQADSQQNWVSAMPTQGWKNGTYSVTFFQMNDSLIPIAQSSFTLSSVIE